jgi:hypothetical protein
MPPSFFVIPSDMKIPEEIMGVNKIRDTSIMVEYANWHHSDKPKTELLQDLVKRLAEKHGITERRIEQIFTKYVRYVFDPEQTDALQLARIHRHIASAPKSIRDSYDWECLLASKQKTKKRDAEESDEKGMTRVIIIRDTGNGNQNQDGAVSRPLSLIRE